MTTTAALIARADASLDSSPFYTSDDLRAASARVRTRMGEDGTIYASVDGREVYRTSRLGDGLWRFEHRQSDGVNRQVDGTFVPVSSWHQILGTAQISGRAHVRGFVVESLAMVSA